MKTLSRLNLITLIITAFMMIGSIKTNAQSKDEMYIKAMYDSFTYDVSILKYYRGATKGLDMYDIKKMSGPDVNLAFYDISDSSQLTASLRPPFSKGYETIPMTFTTSKSAAHQFIFSGTIFTNYSITLVDVYAGVTKVINDGDVYKFTSSNSVSSSVGNARFRLLVGAKLAALPVTYISNTAELKNTDVVVKWSTASEINNDKYEIEYSKDAVSFETVGEVKSAGNSTELVNYEFVHSNIYNNENIYYRIKQTDLNGDFTYTNVMTVSAQKVSSTHIASIYPTPATDIIHINYVTTVSDVTIVLFNMQGQKVNEFANTPSSINVQNMNIGNYILQMTDRSGNVLQTEKIIVVK